MKVLYVVDYYQPQLGYSEYFIPRELKKKGHQVTVLTSNYFFPFPNYEETSGKILGSRRQPAGTFTYEGITVIKEAMICEIFTRAIFRHHEDVVKKVTPDLVIVNKSAGFNVIRMAMLKKKFKYALISYDAHLPSGFFAVGNRYAKEIFYFIFRLLFSRLLNNNVDKFIAVQEDSEIIMRQYYGQKNIVHIPLGTDTDRFKKSAADGKAVRRECNIKSDDFVIIYTGKIIPTKGVHLLFAALNVLLRKYKNGIKLLLVGNGSEEYMRHCYEQLDTKFHAAVVEAGFQENGRLARFYSSANVGVWPLEESTAMNDAAACELPFIANDQIGARIRLANDNALLYQKGNSSDLAKKIEFLFLNEKLCQKMGKNGKALIHSTLSWNKIVDQYLAYANS